MWLHLRPKREGLCCGAAFSPDAQTSHTVKWAAAESLPGRLKWRKQRLKQTRRRVIRKQTTQEEQGVTGSAAAARFVTAATNLAAANA